MPETESGAAAAAAPAPFLDKVSQYFRDFRVLRETRAEYWGSRPSTSSTA